MNESALNKMRWGFILIMIDFRIQGFDILPDVAGYLLFASAFRDLASGSTHFSVAEKYNIPMIVLAMFSIYQAPVQNSGVQLGSLGIVGIIISIAAFVLDLLVVYNLFMGIKDIAEKREQYDLVNESDEYWNKYKMLQIGVLLAFILILIPPLAVVYLIVLFVISIMLTISISDFLKKCGESLIKPNNF